MAIKKGMYIFKRVDGASFIVGGGNISCHTLQLIHMKIVLRLLATKNVPPILHHPGPNRQVIYKLTDTASSAGMTDEQDPLIYPLVVSDLLRSSNGLPSSYPHESHNCRLFILKNLLS